MIDCLIDWITGITRFVEYLGLYFYILLIIITIIIIRRVINLLRWHVARMDNHLIDGLLSLLFLAEFSQAVLQLT